MNSVQSVMVLKWSLLPKGVTFLRGVSGQVRQVSQVSSSHYALLTVTHTSSCLAEMNPRNMNMNMFVGRFRPYPCPNEQPQSQPRPHECQVRRVNCGELRSHHLGERVEMVGWVQRQSMGRFIELRDGHGATQLVVPLERTDLSKRFSHMPLRSYVSVVGCVVPRPSTALNGKMSTGEVEVSVQNVVMVKLNKNVGASGNFSPSKPNARRYSTSARTDETPTSDEIEKCGAKDYMLDILKTRTHTCGGLTENDIGRDVTIVGWAGPLGGSSRFLKLNDGHGHVQCMLPSDDSRMREIAHELTNESFLEVKGTVRRRPANQINTIDSNGNIEVKVDSLRIIDADCVKTDFLSQDLSQNVEKDDDEGLNRFTWRTHSCGELRLNDSGKKVVLCGWLLHRRMGQFFTLRDSYGVTQCLMTNENNESLNSIPFESILKVTGTVNARPANSINQSMPTGEIEVSVENIEILNRANFAPMPVRSFQTNKEQLRLQYRYIDLRNKEMQHNLRLRSKMLMKMRKYLIDHNSFVEVETPTLFCRTPGGAQEFVVPTRESDRFYSLVQSPQQFKQMLMAGAIDRYFQVARCYRDESVSGDRQPEFTQLDIELSFAGVNDVIGLIEGLLRYSWPGPISPKPFKKITYQEAVMKYGTDKPITSYDLEFENLSSIIKEDNKLREKINDLTAYGFVVRGPRVKLSNSQKKNLCETAFKKYKNVIIKVIHESNLENMKDKLKKVMDPDEMERLIARLNLQGDELLAMAIGSGEDTCWALGTVRTKVLSNKELTEEIKRIGGDLDVLWVVDFPLFTKDEDGSLKTCHHPFTAPHPDDIELLQMDPSKVRSLAYDLVIEGNEVGGGSVRAHNARLQRHLLDLLKISPEPLKHLLNALDSGCPPHAGIALGLDRLTTIACDADSIRDVIAFPKSHEGRDPLSGAPAPISEEEKLLYHISVTE